MIRLGYMILGAISLVLGVVGTVVPLLPTVPFVILAAFLFARGHPGVERWLVEHPRFGPHIVAWRTRRAISRRGKKAATAAFAFSITLGFLLLDFPWSFLPLAASLVAGSWIWTRPDG
ncbi:YbaN family protein [Sphingosinicella terrae]|uniref:YbaN family protein n=1 Tax=Sphingosinicella terrae TaxID=2172047 RepID=UPI000E0CE07F|nr:YbaN family protein [Sphingosinicella terrae]